LRLRASRTRAALACVTPAIRSARRSLCPSSVVISPRAGARSLRAPMPVEFARTMPCLGLVRPGRNATSVNHLNEYLVCVVDCLRSARPTHLATRVPRKTGEAAAPEADKFTVAVTTTVDSSSLILGSECEARAGESARAPTHSPPGSSARRRGYEVSVYEVSDTSCGHRRTPRAGHLMRPCGRSGRHP
jgi:hypothetical protein